MNSIREGIKKEVILSGEERWCCIYDEKEILNRIEDLTAGFGKNCQHTYAIKACTLSGVSKIFIKKGLGIECASWEEVELGLRYGCDPSKIVFDSPCKVRRFIFTLTSKTRKEIEDSIKKNIFLINADSLDEFDRIVEIMEKNKDSKSNVGLRINPQFREMGGKDEMTSTTTPSSKFGFAINEYGVENFIKKIKDIKCLTALHIHTGSGGDGFKVLNKGCEYIIGLAREVNKQLGRDQIKIVDIGGGHPVPLKGAVSFKKYWEGIFKIEGINDFKIVTEFGRGMVCTSGYIATRVEYVKYGGKKQIAVIHVGADLCPMVVYTKGRIMEYPEVYLNSDGSLKDLKAEKVELEKKEKNGEKIPSCLEVVGPLCFSGDIVCYDRQYIPSLKSEDVIVFKHAGAYTMSTWSKFNCRRMGRVLMLKQNGKLEVIKEKESLEKNLSFWE